MNTKMFNMNGQEYVAPGIELVQLFAEEVIAASFEGDTIEDGNLEDWGIL